MNQEIQLMTSVPARVMNAAELMTYSSCRLLAVKNGQIIGTGTGFFYEELLNPDQLISLVVTNKHVIEGADEVAFDIHVASSKDADRVDTGQTERFRLPLNEHTIIPHPNADVDLCGLAVAGVIAQMNDMGRPPFYSALGPADIPGRDQWADFSVIETVTMVGFPNGLADEHHQMPLVRQGITATALHRDYNGRPEFMVDMACFPGSSGSPVFVWNPNHSFSRSQNRTTIGKATFFLVGILYRGPLIDNEGRIVLNRGPRVLVDSMMHLGEVIKADQIALIVDEVKRRVSSYPAPS